MLDGTVLRAHQHAAGKKGCHTQALRRSRGGFSTKIHLTVDAHGNRLASWSAPGHTHESRHAIGPLMGVEPGYALGDRAYDGSPIREAIAGMGAKAVIPPHPRRKDPAHDDSHL